MMGRSYDAVIGMVALRRIKAQVNIDYEAHEFSIEAPLD